MLMGRYDYTVDAKSRTNFPPKFKAEMGETLYITKWFDSCLVVYGEEEWAKLDSKFDDKSVFKVKDITRMLYGNATDVTADKQGRILIPQYLKDHAGITKDIVIIGARSYAEIWDKSAYEEKQKQTDFEMMCQKLEDMEF